MRTLLASQRAIRFSELSHEPQVRLCEVTNFGIIRSLEIWEGEPVFDPPPVVIVDLKLGVDEAPRAEHDFADFLLCCEVLQLMDRLDELVTASIEAIEIRVGIPRRLFFQAAVANTAGSPPRSGEDT